jgi:signal transduction histidine kinase
VLELLVHVEADVRRMSALITSLLAYTRIGNAAPKLDSCNCEKLLSDATGNLSALIMTTGADIRHEPLPVLRGDPVLMTSVFQNLLENALKYHRPGEPPLVHVSAAETESDWVISVADNGVGVPKEHVESVFRPFQQVAGRDGLGLGLANCERIVKRHGGRIWVKSRTDGGSVFSFNIPKKAGHGATACL